MLWPCDEMLTPNSCSNCDNKIEIRASISIDGKGTDRYSTSQKIGQ